MKAWHTAVLILSSSLFAACGGGGSGTGSGTGDSGSGGQGSTSTTPTLSLLAGNVGGPGNVDGAAAVASFSALRGIAVDGAGNVYVADTPNASIRKVSPGGMVSTLVGTAGKMTAPTCLALDGAGNLYVFDTANQVVSKIAADGTVSKLATLALAYGGAPGFAVDAAGNVIVTDPVRTTVLKVTSSGAVSILAGNPAGSANGNGVIGGKQIDGVGQAAQFIEPNSIAADAAGNVFVADYDTLRKIAPDGTVTTIAGSVANRNSIDGAGAAAGFYGLNALAIDGAGNVYGTDVAGIRKITPAGAVTTVIANTSATNALINAAALAFDKADIFMLSPAAASSANRRRRECKASLQGRL